ncbi:uncharacterized protein LOC119082294 [Bradysia coprophila]|uniref:uncharacterized protein LOC119082294 n=1 Tax=Bradysia coprophila TaxID=38358 RepID=UPI00187DB0C8|nr:uncharacterized protein LOC119082294 [Bradysia coprophila]
MPGGSTGGTSGTGTGQADTAVPLPATFDESDNWLVYNDKLDQFFIAYGITDDSRKRAILLTSLSEDVYSTLSDLCFPELPGSKTYKDIAGLMKKRFSPIVSIYRERLRFYEAKQKPNEKIVEFCSRLKKLTKYCSFGDYLTQVLRDKFVCGLSKGPVFDKVCEQNATESFETLVEVALKKELADKERTTDDSLEVCKVEQHRNGAKPNASKVFNNNTSNQSTKRSCYACGGSNHLFNACKFKSYKCKNCKVTGHLAKVCKQKSDGQKSSKPQQPKPSNNYINLDDDSDFERLTIKQMNLKVHNVSCESEEEADEKFYTQLSIRKKLHQFEVDTGSPISACSVTFYKQNFSDIPLQQFKKSLESYNKSPLKNLGYFEVDVVFKSTVHKLRLIVIVNGGEPLIGRDFLRKIKKHKGVSLNNLECSDPVIKRLIDENKELFRDELGVYKHGKVRLELEANTVPIFRKARPVPIAFQDEYKRQISDKIERGILKRVDYSDWGTPLVSAPKPNGGLRICGDYSITVNPHIKPVVYSLPLIDDLFASLNGGQTFSKIDLTDAYYQLELDEDSQKMLAWSTQEGIFVPTRMPFGISPASSIFHSIISKTLQGCKGAINLIDDILVTGRNKQEHLDNLSEVFKRLKEAGFTLRPNKCEFFKEQVKYLGYIIDKNGLHKDLQKIEAIFKAPRPRDITAIKSFVGLVGFYSRFFPNMAQVLGPIYNLLKKENKFEWTRECDESFELVKTVIASDKILIHYDPKLPVRLQCDASVYGIGAAIFHVLEDGPERPIAFASRTLRKAEKNYSTPDREALAIYFGVKRFAHYLIGRRFSLKTDHKPLLSIFGAKKGISPLAAGRLQRWALYLANFTFDIEHIKGKDNAIADFLSRFPIDDPDEEDDPDVCFVNFLTRTGEKLIDSNVVKAEAAKDAVMIKVKEFLQK